MSTRSKFIAILLLCLAAAAAGVSLAARHHAAKEAEAAFDRRASAQLDRAEDIIRIYFMGAEQAARNLASLPEVRNIALSRSGTPPPGAEGEDSAAPSAGETALGEGLNALPALIPGVEAAFCGYKNGSFHGTPGMAPTEGYDPRAQSWYSDTAWGLADTAVADVSLSGAGKSLAATVTARIKGDAGETLGVAALVLNLAALTDALGDIRPGRTGRLLLFDGKGRVLFDPAAQENALLPAAQAGPAVFTLMQLPPGRHTLAEGTDGAPLDAFVRVLGDSRWKAVLTMRADETAAPGRRVATGTMLAAVLVFLVLAAAGIALAFAATRPLHALIRQSTSLADGDDGALTGIPGRGPDITALQGNFGRLTGRVILLAQAEKEHARDLEAQVRKTLEAEAALEDAARTGKEDAPAASGEPAHPLGPAAADLAAAISGLAGRMAGFCALAREQAASADTVRATVAVLREDTATAARQAAETEKSAESALLLARDAGKPARETARAAEALEDLLASRSPAPDAAKDNAGGVAALAGSVRDVAEAINVMGLKLSIEVTGAGEAGKKFLPVAEEMRAVAEKAMTLAGTMEETAAALEQADAARALAFGKTVTAAKRAATGAAQTGGALAGTTAAAATVAEQARVLATTLEGLAQTDAADADALARLSRDVEEAARDIERSVADMALLAARLAAVTESLHPAG